MTAQQKWFSRPCDFHDQMNLLLLPLLAALAVAGLAGLVDTYTVTCTLTAYIVADLGWLLVQPECVPSLSGVIVLHHCVTLALLSVPLRYPHLGVFACLDGSVELNTFFLIARRQVSSPQWARIYSALYWATFIPLRLAMYPYLLLPFYHALNGHPLHDKVLCLGCQLMLCAFNGGLLLTHVRSARRRKQRALAAAAQAVAAADVTAKSGCVDSIPPTVSPPTEALANGEAEQSLSQGETDAHSCSGRELSPGEACGRHVDSGIAAHRGHQNRDRTTPRDMGPHAASPASKGGVLQTAGSRRKVDGVGSRCSAPQFQVETRARVALRPRFA